MWFDHQEAFGAWLVSACGVDSPIKTMSAPPPIIKPAVYLAAAAQARALYTTLFEACLVAMPMNPAGEHNVECHYTARDLTAKLPGRSTSVIQNELRWLENNSWLITNNGNMRFLGRRINGTFHLLADITAKQMTGEERFVSSNILGIKLPGPPVTAKAAKRGAARKWDGPTTGGGGAFDLAPRT